MLRILGKKSYQKIRKNQQIHFIWKEKRILDYFMKKNVFPQFIAIFLTLLLCKISV